MERDEVRKRLKAVEEERSVHLGRLHMTDGAVQVLRSLLDDWDKPKLEAVGEDDATG